MPQGTLLCACTCVCVQYFNMYTIRISLSHGFRVHPNYSVSDAPLVATRSLSKKPPLASIGSHRPPQQAATHSSVPTSVTSRYPDSMTLPSLVSAIVLVCGNSSVCNVMTVGALNYLDVIPGSNFLAVLV